MAPAESTSSLGARVGNLEKDMAVLRVEADARVDRHEAICDLRYQAIDRNNKLIIILLSAEFALLLGNQPQVVGFVNRLLGGG